MTIRYTPVNPYPDNLQTGLPQISGKELLVLEAKELDPIISVTIEAEDIVTTTTPPTTTQPVPDPITGIAPDPVTTPGTSTSETFWVPVTITSVTCTNKGITTAFSNNTFTASGKFIDVFTREYTYKSNESSATNAAQSLRETLSTATGIATSIASGYKLITKSVPKIANIPTGFHHMEKYVSDALRMKVQSIEVKFTSNASTVTGEQTIQYNVHVWKDWDKGRDDLKALVKQGRF